MEDTLIKEISRLSKREKLTLVEALWDSIAAEPEGVEMPEHHKIVLDERLKAFGKEEGVTWADLRKKYL